MANGEPDNRFLRRNWSAGRSSAHMFKVSELAVVKLLLIKPKSEAPAGRSPVFLEGFV